MHVTSNSILIYLFINNILEASRNLDKKKYRKKTFPKKKLEFEFKKGKTAAKKNVNEVNYLDNKLESTSYICIAADNNHNVDIADSHIKERAATNLSHRTCTKFFGLHYMHPESINHISPDIKNEG